MTTNNTHCATNNTHCATINSLWNKHTHFKHQTVMRRTYFTKALATALLTCAAATANAQSPYDYYVSESSHGVCYKADNVVMNVGMSGVDINMKLLGETSDECRYGIAETPQASMPSPYFKWTAASS